MIPCRCRRLGLSDSDSPHVGPVKYRFSCDFNTDRHDDEPLPALNPWKRHRGCPTPSSHNIPKPLEDTDSYQNYNQHPESVLSGSPAENCGLRPGDVLFKFSDTIVVSPLQLFEIIWDMAGKTVEVAVVREGSYKNMKIEVKDITSADEFYQWPVPKAYYKGSW
ncbi:putative protease Do [Trifolium repens]|nr:putative protease Do [Trifolium repens]